MSLQPFIYLASQSPRRAELLRQVGIDYRILPARAGEDLEALEVVRAGESPTAYVRRVAGLKLEAALRRREALELIDAPVLCADTTVALGRDILGKPASVGEATLMLRRLSGRSHRVLTALALGRKRRRVYALSVSRVTFRQLSLAQVKAYVASGEPMGKAGAYAVQGRAALFISRIQGSYSGIMGLPLFETGQLLADLGLRP